MNLMASPRAPRGLTALIVAITVVPLAILSWLGWRLLEQDRAFERQQVQQRVERATDRVVAALHRGVSASESRLAAGAGDWPEGAVAVIFRNDRVDATPRERLAFLPVVAPLPEAPAATFAGGEDLEFRRGDLNAAIRVFEGLSRSPDPTVRAGALLRLGRSLRNAGQPEMSLAAYTRLAALDQVSVGGVPAGLVARYARCRLLDENTRFEGLRAEAGELDRLLHSGRWALIEPVYRLYARDVAKWTGRQSATPVRSEVLADAVGALWEKWALARAGDRASAGYEALDVDGETLIVLRQSSGGVFRTLVASASFVESQWLAAASAIAREEGIAFGIMDGNGRQRSGPLDKTGFRARRSANDTSLPWTVATAAVIPPLEDLEFASRRRMLIAGFVLLVSMASAASYLIIRAVSREVAVARLQSEFVAAVSHEFRTPLTSLRQFTDMLREHPVLDEDRRHIAYEAQARAADRLTRLVESLLDFGRMEAGVRRYQFEPRESGDLVRRIVEDFRGDANQAERVIEFHANQSGPIDVDEDAITLALRNLLDNAVKYSSPGAEPIEIDLERRNGQVRIQVRDRGIGIPAAEMAHIFTKFRRGQDAQMRGIKGTGIGLAMVEEIVRAHHGRVEVVSEPGHGSTFTIVLPVKG